MKLARHAQELVSIETLRAMFAYTAETGTLVWIGKTSRNGKVRNGQPVGSLDRKGYLRVSLAIGPKHERKVRAFSHRVAWALHYGEWPPDDMTIDHINNVKTDNRIINLRLATNQQNCFNSKARPSRAGLKGVSFVPGNPNRPWVAAICVDGKVNRLGFFATAEEAHARYCEAAAQCHGRFARAA